MAKKQISFLLGAGFSKPAGYPLASEMNSYFIDMEESDITIRSDGSARFNAGNPEPNDGHTRNDEKKFFVRLIKFYRENVGEFHYEDFYDWYKSLQSDPMSITHIQSIIQDQNYTLDQLLLNFDFTFIQLLAQPLSKRYPEVHYSRGLPTSHANFLFLVECLEKQYTLQFHTLNHDLFFESLSSTDAIQGKLSDGFTELGSPYYGRLYNIVQAPNGGDAYSYTVRLPYFANKYNNDINLFKLHGSIDHFVFWNDDHITVKNKRGIGPGDLLMETYEGGRHSYVENRRNFYPDFLSGTTYKMQHYNSTPYYETMFEHFRNNLLKAHTLVVIGYSFSDMEINKIIKQTIISNQQMRIAVIDISNSPKLSEFGCRIMFFDGGVTYFSVGDLISYIHSQ